VILSGGSGTRLWPLSTPGRPKQFAELIPGHPNLFEATLGRLDGMPGAVGPIIVTGADHIDLVGESVKRAGIEPGLIIIEPTGRNTAPAVAAAALATDPGDVLVLLPSDHLIVDEGRFRDHVVSAATHAAEESIVVFGVTPTRPETGYGYIEKGEPAGGAWRVVRFKEKPEYDEAASMATDGRHMWNAGMFVAGAGVLVSEMELTTPAVIDGVRGAMTPAHQGVVQLGPGFATVESVSFDHAVMERTGRALVIPIEVGWDDIGSYQALMGHMERDAEGNVVTGPVVLERVRGSFVMATSRVVAVAGVDDMVVVETPDGVLVVPLEEAQTVRSLVERAHPAG
jgi:mannose-1-phosphate guanylyltransferase/mannose-6-phosphate isomerase